MDLLRARNRYQAASEFYNTAIVDPSEMARPDDINEAELTAFCEGLNKASQRQMKKVVDFGNIQGIRLHGRAIGLATGLATGFATMNISLTIQDSILNLSCVQNGLDKFAKLLNDRVRVAFFCTVVLYWFARPVIHLYVTHYALKRVAKQALIMYHHEEIRDALVEAKRHLQDCVAVHCNTEEGTNGRRMYHLVETRLRERITSLENLVGT